MVSPLKLAMYSDHDINIYGMSPCVYNITALQI